MVYICNARTEVEAKWVKAGQPGLSGVLWRKRRVVGEMAQWLRKELMLLTLRTWVQFLEHACYKEKTDSLKLSFDLHMHAMACVHRDACTYEWMNVIVFFQQTKNGLFYSQYLICLRNYFSLKAWKACLKRKLKVIHHCEWLLSLNAIRVILTSSSLWITVVSYT